MRNQNWMFVCFRPCGTQAPRKLTNVTQLCHVAQEASGVRF